VQFTDGDWQATGAMLSEKITLAVGFAVTISGKRPPAVGRGLTVSSPNSPPKT
jgi:hypothetical protein